MRQELKDWISVSMGPSAWEELLSIEAEVRKRKKEDEYRKEEIKEAIINWAVGILAVVTGIAIMVGIIYLITLQQGKI